MEKLTEKAKWEIAGVGGLCPGTRLSNISLVFQTIDKTDIEEKLPFIIILRSPPQQIKTEKTYEIPNLLGLDIIRRYQLKFDKHNVYLERE